MAGYPGNERHSQSRRSSDYTSLGNALGGQTLYSSHSQNQSQLPRGQAGQQPQQYPGYPSQQQQPAYHQNYQQHQNWSTGDWNHPQQHSGYSDPSQHAHTGPSPGPLSARPSTPVYAARRPSDNARRGSVISRTASPRSSASSPPPNNFSQLAGTYHTIMEATSGERPPDPATIQRMLLAATHGQQLLNRMTPPPQPPQRAPSAAPVPVSAPTPMPHQPQPASPSSSSSASRSSHGHSEQHQPAEPGQACLGCGANQTPEWRRGPLGPRTLCNACGLVYAKMLKKRAHEPTGYGDRTNEEDEDGNSPSYAPR
ncbi:hypothetical protein PENSPDRAFT_652483 [Peniophora sp. CONT]|nr:hypothetical protein PENSPDRAFT_652483 [Peniophora sp. CONT]